jgi:hypothetical protein
VQHVVHQAGSRGPGRPESPLVGAELIVVLAAVWPVADQEGPVHWRGSRTP